MSKNVDRNYLEIHSLNDLVESKNPPSEYLVELIDPPNFQLNKFFYKNIGKHHSWKDRLQWQENQWIDFTTNKNLKTFVLKKKKGSCGIF